MQTFGLVILVLIAAPSLAWHLLCAGRWLRRRLWPTFSEQVDGRFIPYKPPLPHPLWAVDTAMAQRRAAWAMGSPGGSCLKEGKTVVIPPPLTEEEVEEALHIPRTGQSLDGSWPAMTPPADLPSIESTSSPSSTVSTVGSRGLEETAT